MRTGRSSTTSGRRRRTWRRWWSGHRCCESSRARAVVKPEYLQPTGAFKLRGAVNAVSLAAGDVRAAGVVTDSSGNHGQALAYTARRVGIACVVVMPDVAPPFKIDAVRAWGPRSSWSPRRAPVPGRGGRGRAGLAVVPPFDHRDIIAGQARSGWRSWPTCPDAAVLVPVGGGGLASGVASAVKALRPEVRVVGVEPELAGDAAESLGRAG